MNVYLHYAGRLESKKTILTIIKTKKTTSNIKSGITKRSFSASTTFPSGE